MRIVAAFLALLMLLSVASYGQFKDQGLGIGAGFGVAIGQTDLQNNEVNYAARAFVRLGLLDHFAGELGAGIGRISGTEYKTLLVPVDVRLLFSPLDNERWNPYAYAGIGMLYHKFEVSPSFTLADTKRDAVTGVVPAGVGLQYMVDDNLSIEASGGYNQSFSKKLNNAVVKDQADAYWNVLLGFSIVGEGGSADPDKDGLTNNQEKQLGTNKRNADTDTDGLSDGDEVNKYSTSPLESDSDGDGIKDGDEILTAHTNPNKADSDGDGLNDKAEIEQFKTDPNKADSDGDGLNDKAEIEIHKTDPLKSDTDGDLLSDGSEVDTHKSDPLKTDSDGGTIDDGTEVNRGSNPNDAEDDIPKPQIKVEVGQAIVLDGIVFATGKSDITPESENILIQAYNTLNLNPEIVVEIRGYTDNKGRKSSNKKLSLARAEAVKAWLVGKGIAADRVGTQGFGQDNPVAPNTSDEGRQKNRRIEFFRSK
jgi:outer membrane protein OmpA-like peptidoglycan-associated protein